MARKKAQHHYLDNIDLLILVALSCGVTSLTYICNFLGRPNATIQDRVIHLIEEGLVRSSDSAERHFFKNYTLEGQGMRIVADVLKDINVQLILSTTAEALIVNSVIESNISSLKIQKRILP